MTRQADDEVPHMEGIYRGEAPECVGTCCFKTRTETKDQTPAQLLADFRAYCESPALPDYCRRHGVNFSKFTWNHRIQGISASAAAAPTTNAAAVTKDNHQHHHHRFHFPRFSFGGHDNKHYALYQQFWKAYQEDSSLNLALAFHGTPEKNVSKILKEGLDPQYRRTQAFGNGEYFAKEPGLSATYRQEGHCLLVYLLLVPKDHEKLFSQKDRDIIVVEDGQHQLPLGVISFDTVSERRIQYSQNMRLVQRGLKEAAKECDWRIKQETLLVDLKQSLKEGRIADAAAALKCATKYHKLTEDGQQEFAAVVQPYCKSQSDVDAFPSLKAAFSSSPPSDNNTPVKKSIPALQEEARQAWRAFLVMKMDPHRNWMDKPTAGAAAIKPRCGAAIVEDNQEEQELHILPKGPGAKQVLLLEQ